MTSLRDDAPMDPNDNPLKNKGSISVSGLRQLLHRPRPALPSIAPPVASQPTAGPITWADLRRKWCEVPAGILGRTRTDQLLDLGDDALLSLWHDLHRETTVGAGYRVRGWYQDLYRDAFRGKSILDVGSGLGFDGLHFALSGARVTCLDLVESNLRLIARLSDLLGLKDVVFHHLRDLESLEALPSDFDVLWAQGSLIHAPFEFMQAEVTALLRHLSAGGRVIALAYPRERWLRDGSPSFRSWGEMTDGAGTPWCEWYDLEKLLELLAPGRFEVLLAFNFHDDDFNWFDLKRTA